ncbi:MAG: thioredoxin-disulfide reductase [Deferribacteraceae bacterium]|jgi:thioredoxin reductase (NADPH)|nr:thioredoxin-disulfide reductase [Deferribacteraceae bacterium]
MKDFFNIKDIRDSYDIVIIGGGPAGAVAGMYASRDAYSTLVMEMETPGGLMGNTDIVENHPGIPKALDGFSLSERYYEHAVKFGANIKNLSCSCIEPSDNSFLVFAEQLEKPVRAKTVIIASGSSPKRLGAPGEEMFAGHGVSYCATCDGHFYEGRRVAAVGGGNTALAEAHYLTRFAEKVYLIHRRDEFRGDKALVKKVISDPRIEIFYSSVITSVNGKKRVESAEVKDLKTGDLKTVNLDGVFIFVGQTPHTAPFRDLIELNEQGYIIADESTLTNVKGVFAAGDVRTKQIRQIATAVSDGVVAAKQAEIYLSNLEG